MRRNMKPTAVTYMTCSRGTPAFAASLKASGSRSKRDTAMSTPAAKAASIPNLFLYRTANNPPTSVETNVSAPKMIGYIFMHLLALTAGNHDPVPAAMTLDGIRDVSAKGQGLTIGLPSNIFRITFVIHLGKPALQVFYDLSCLLG